jgi:hypothetical protein
MSVVRIKRLVELNIEVKKQNEFEKNVLKWLTDLKKIP